MLDNLSLIILLRKNVLCFSKKLKTWQAYRIGQYTLQNDFIKEYKSLSEATRAMNKKQSRYIKECCDGKRENMYGFVWKYLK